MPQVFIFLTDVTYSLEKPVPHFSSITTVCDLDVNVDTEIAVKLSTIILHKHICNPNEVNKSLQTTLSFRNSVLHATTGRPNGGPR